MINETKQTGLKFFLGGLIDLEIGKGIQTDKVEELHDLYNQAKEIEKENMQYWFRLGMHLVEGSLYKPSDKFEEYYQEKYEGKKL